MHGISIPKDGSRYSPSIRRSGTNLSGEGVVSSIDTTVEFLVKHDCPNDRSVRCLQKNNANASEIIRMEKES